MVHTERSEPLVAAPEASRPRRRNASLVAAIFAAALLVVTTTAAVAPAADARSAGKASVTNHRATMDSGGGVPVKVHCGAPSTSHCTGNLRLVSKLSPGNIVSSFRHGFTVRGGHTRTIRIQAAGPQIERVLQVGSLKGTVKIKEKKPRAVPVHSSPITVHRPA